MNNKHKIIMVFLLFTFLFYLKNKSMTIDTFTSKYNAHSYFLQGLIYLRQNNLSKAQYMFEKTIELDRTSPAPLKELLLVYLQLGKIEKAQEILNNLKQISDDANIKLFLGVSNLLLGDTTAAIVEYESVLTEKPENFEAMIALAGLYSKVNPEKALSLWEKFISLNPDSSEAYYYKAQTLRKLKRLDEAKETLKSALERKTDDILLRMSLSEIYEEEHKFLLSADELYKCIKSISNNIDLYIRVGGLYFLGKDYEKAEDIFKQTLKITPDEPVVYYWLSLVYEEKKEWEKAILYLEKATAKQSDIANYIRLSYYYTQLKNTKHAVKILEKTIKLNPQSYEAYFFLGLGYMDLKKYKKAEKCFIKTTNLEPTLSDAHFYLGVIYEQTNRFEKSIPHFRKAIELNPKNAAALNYLGYSSADRNINLDEAKELIEKALELDPENGAYIDSLGWIYFRKGKYKEAKIELEKAIKRQKDPIIYEHLGDVEKVLKNKEESKEYYKKALELDPENKQLKRKLKKLE